MKRSLSKCKVLLPVLVCLLVFSAFLLASCNDKPEHEHRYDQIAEVPATCTEAGVKAHYHCAGCNGDFLQQDGVAVSAQDLAIASRGHTPTHHDAVAATCTANGNVEYWSCSACQKNFGDANGATEITGSVVLDATGHTLTHHDAVAATCTANGNIEYWSCAACQKNFGDANGATEITGSVVLDAAGHTLMHHDAVAATCTANGNIEYWSCSACQKNFSDANGATEITGSVVLDATGHAYEYNYETYKYVCTHTGCTGSEIPAGTADDPYLVKDDATLYDVLTNKGGYVKFTNDIVCIGEIKITKTVNIDFDGHTLSYHQTENRHNNGRRNWTVLNFFSGSAGSVVRNGKTVYTVAANVTGNVTARTIAVNDDVKLLIENMQMESTPCAVIVMDNSQTTIRNCEIIGSFDTLKAIQYGPSTKNLILEIDNSKVVSTGLTGILVHDSYLTVNIKNGSEITGFTSAICAKMGNITVDETSKLCSTRADFVYRRTKNKLTTDIGYSDCDGSAIVLLTNLIYDGDAKTNELYLNIANWDNVTAASGVKVSVYKFDFTGSDPYASYRNKDGHTVVDQFAAVESKLAAVEGVRYFFFTGDVPDVGDVLVERIAFANGEYLYYNYNGMVYSSLSMGGGKFTSAGSEEHPYLVSDDSSWYNAIRHKGGHIKLVCDIVVTGNTLVSKETYIDLNGHTVFFTQRENNDTSLERANCCILYFRTVKAVIKNGTIKYTIDNTNITKSTYGSTVFQVERESQLLLDNMRIESDPAAFRIYENSKTTIRNSEIIGDWGTILAEANVGPSPDKSQCIEIDNSKIVSNRLTAMYIALYTTVDIKNNSEIVGYTSAIYARMGNIKVDATSKLYSTRTEFGPRTKEQISAVGAGWDDRDGVGILLSLNHYYDQNAKTNEFYLDIANWNNVTAASGVKVAVYNFAEADYYQTQRVTEGCTVVDQFEQACRVLCGVEGVRYFLYTKDSNGNVLVELEYDEHYDRRYAMNIDAELYEVCDDIWTFRTSDPAGRDYAYVAQTQKRLSTGEVTKSGSIALWRTIAVENCGGTNGRVFAIKAGEAEEVWFRLTGAEQKTLEAGQRLSVNGNANAFVYAFDGKCVMVITDPVSGNVTINGFYSFTVDPMTHIVTVTIAQGQALYYQLDITKAEITAITAP